MKDSRIGESLWLEWTGDGLDYGHGDVPSFYTEGHIDIDNDIVRRALASALQREGVVDSLGDGYRALDKCSAMHGHAAYVDGDIDLSIIGPDEVTQYEDLTDDILEITLVTFWLET